FAEDDVGFEFLTVSEKADRHLVTGAPRRDLCLEIDHARDPVTVDRNDEVTRLHTGFGRWGIRFDLGKDRPLAGSRRITTADTEEPTFGRLTGHDPIGNDLRDVDRDGEPDADVSAALGTTDHDRVVDSDDPTGQVGERPAGV